MCVARSGTDCIRATQAKAGRGMLITCSAVNGPPRGVGRGAHLAGFTQPHGPWNRISADRAARERLDDRGDRSRLHFGRGHIFEPSEDFARLPAECSRRYDVRQRETCCAEGRQKADAPPHLHLAQTSLTESLRFRRFRQRARPRAKEIEPATDFTTVHYFAGLVAAQEGCGSLS